MALGAAERKVDVAGARFAAAGASFTLAGVMAAHALMETARDTLFFTKLPPSRLAWVYVAIAAGSLVVARARRGYERLPSSRVLGATLVLCGAVTLGFWRIADSDYPAVFYALYVWAGLCTTTVVAQLWVVVAEAYTIVQAKRVYSFIAAGGTIGAVAGAATARLLASRIDVRGLLLVAGAIFAITGVTSLVGLRRTVTEPAQASRAGTGLPSVALAGMRKDPYLARIAALILLSTLALTTVDYLYKTTVARTVEPARLASTYATVNLVLNAVALLAQLLVVPWLLRHAGVIRALGILPAVLVGGALAIVVGGGLAAALALVTAGGALRYSLNDTATELLYVPVPATVRSRFKGVVDTLARRGGQAIASFGILAVASVSAGATLLGCAVAVLAAVWLWLALGIRRHYLELFRASLRRGAIETRVDLPALDVTSLELLVAALASRHDGEVLAALQLLEAEGRAELVPAHILQRPSPAVVIHALGLFERSGRDDGVADIDGLLTHRDAEVRAAAVSARSKLRPEEPVLRAALADHAPPVRAKAVVALVAGGWMDLSELEGVLWPMLRQGSTDARLALASALLRGATGKSDDVLLALADAPEHAVRIEVAQAMGDLGRPVFLPSLRAMLADRVVRPSARRALVAMGSEALSFLERSLGDVELPHEVRRHIPRTISRFDPAKAIPILLGRLLQEPDGAVRFKILRGLGRLHNNHPALPLDREILATATERTLAGAFRMVAYRLVLERGAEASQALATPGGELLRALLRDRETMAVGRLFRLLALAHPDEDFERIHRGLRAHDPSTRASSRELLENVLVAPLRGPVLALTDELPDAARLERARPYDPPASLDTPSVLGALLDQGGEALRCIAAYHVAELGLTELAPRLAAMRGDGSRFAVEVVARALELLEPRGEGAPHA